MEAPLLPHYPHSLLRYQLQDRRIQAQILTDTMTEGALKTLLNMRLPLISTTFLDIMYEYKEHRATLKA